MFSATDQESRVKLGWWLVLAIWVLLTIVGEIIVFPCRCSPSISPKKHTSSTTRTSSCPSLPEVVGSPDSYDSPDAVHAHIGALEEEPDEALLDQPSDSI